MKNIPILFSTPMVQAILSGRKTMTRRIVKREPLRWLEDSGFTPEFVADPDNNLCPYGKVGDVLWIREKFETDTDGYVRFYAGNIEVKHNKSYERLTKWKPSIHMRKADCRIFLEVVSVRVERLLDISRGDAMTEGCPFPNIAKETNPKEWFQSLWQSINGTESWEANPYVWVIEFKRIDKPQTFIP